MAERALTCFFPVHTSCRPLHGKMVMQGAGRGIPGGSATGLSVGLWRVVDDENSIYGL